MRAIRGNITGFARAMLCFTCAFALVSALVPASAFAAPAQDEPGKAATIAELLAKGPYVEGEIIVAESGSKAVEKAKHVEELMDVEDEALAVLLDSRAAENEDEPALDEAEALEAASREDADISVHVVSDAKLSTEELLEKYLGSPGVISAEPNYTQVCAQAVANVSKLKACALASFEGSARVGDMSAYQWGMGNDGAAGLTGGASSGFDIGVESWKDAQAQGAWSTASANASGSIAVCDTGIDFTHPDLLGTGYDGDLSSFGGAAYGINVTEHGSADDVEDRNGHGTQCAGIIAANWDGSGLSGVVNGAQLIAVKMLEDDGTSTSANVIKAYAYLDSIAEEANLKVVNNSWTIMGSSVSVELAVNQLGQHGAVSVFSSGNSSLDLDENLSVASSISSPYAVVVNSYGNSGELSRFSNYGYSGTDFAAPGENIVTSVPTALYGSAALSEDGEGLVALESFGGTDSAAYAVTNSDGEAIGTRNGSYTYDNVGTSYSVALDETDNIVSGKTRVSTFQIALDVDEKDVSEIAAVGLRSIFANAYSTKYYPACLVKITGIQTVDGDGEVDMHELLDMDEYLSSGFSNLVNSVGTRYNCWNMETANVSSALGKGEKVCLDDDGRVAVEVSVATDVTSGQATPESVKVAFDRVALYSAAASAGAYKYVSGTSFAAPFAAGAAAVLAVGEPANSEMEAGELEETSLERAAQLKAHVRAAGTLEDSCRSDGRLDLSVADGDLAPVVEGFEVQENSITIQGRFLGSEEGALHVDGLNFEVLEWTPERIVAVVPHWLSNGSQRLSIERADGRYTHVRVATSASSSGISLYPSTLDLPSASEGFDSGSADCNAAAIAAVGSTVYLLFSDEQGNAAFLFCYDTATGAWTPCRGTVPQVTVAENALTTYGSSLVLTGKYKTSSGATETRAYLFNATYGVWSRLLSTVQLPNGCSVVGIRGSLYVVGGMLGSSRCGISRYDVLEQELVPVADYPDVPTLALPVVAASAGYLYALSNHSTGRMLYRCNLSKGDPAMKAVPGVVNADGSSSSIAYTLAALPDGVAIFGSDVAGADTLLLPNDSDAALPYARCASAYALNAPLGAYCDPGEDGGDGYRLYVYGSAAGEQGSAFFRSSGLISVSGEGFRNIAKAKVSIDGQLYDGSSLRPNVVVSFGSASSATTLKAGRDYTLDYADNTGLGEGSVTVNGKGKYYGSTTATFNISLADASIKSLSFKKGTVKVSWGKAAAKVDGYQLRYSKKKSMSKNTKVKVEGRKSTSESVKKLSAKKRYYFQIRTYCKVNGKTCYSSWSKKKSVKG